MEALKRKVVKVSPRVKVVFEPADPDTPVMVYGMTGIRETSSATFFCATDVGELTGAGYDDPDYYPTEAEMEALHKLTDEAEAYYDYARRDWEG